MKIGLLEIYFDYFLAWKYSTLYIAVLPIETINSGDTSFFSIGIYDGDFMFEVFFYNFFSRKFELWKDRRNS